MKRHLIIFCGLLFYTFASSSMAQSRSVIGSGGRSVQNGSIRLDYTIGEAVVSPKAVAGSALQGGYQVPTRYDFWTTSIGLIGGWTGDPDADGAPNLMEYATGTNPNSSTSVQRPTVELGPGGKLYISMTKDPLRTDVLWRAQGSKNLVNWSTMEVSTPVNTASLFTALFTGEAPGFLRIVFYLEDAK
jgi:hypothetical protein